MTGPQKMKEKGIANRERLAGLILPLYWENNGHKAIARELGLSPRIVREVLIHKGVWKPRITTSGRKGMGVHSRVLRAEQKKENQFARCIKHRDKRVTKCLKGVKVKLTNSQRFKARYANDPAFCVYQCLRQRMKKMIKRNQKCGSSIELLGCTSEYLKTYLELQFLDGMNWDNLGVGEGKWNIDHVRPCASFNLFIPSQQRECFHFSNLQPLWSRDNIIKGSFYDGKKHKHTKN